MVLLYLSQQFKIMLLLTTSKVLASRCRNTPTKVELKGQNFPVCLENLSHYKVIAL